MSWSRVWLPTTLAAALFLGGCALWSPSLPEATVPARRAPPAHAAHEPPPPPVVPGVEEGGAELGPVPLYDGLGDFSRTITTFNPRAQDYFNQGIRLTYAFGHPEAIRAFRYAQQLDPECAMCFWGEAWALGPYINSPMDSAGGVAAHRAIQEARRHAVTRATGVERGLIEAMAVRYAAVPTEENRPGLDSLYADTMRQLYYQHQLDADIGTLFAESLMVLRPWDQWTRDGRPQPGTEEVLQTLEAVLGRDIRHPGACHLYIHATEASTDPGRAVPCADLLGDRIPGASHIAHMPSHTYVRVGRWGDAVRANQRAWHADQRAGFGGPPGIYPTHNLHMLVHAAGYDGQSAVAAQAARDLARLSPGAAFYEGLVMARFGRWNDLLDHTAGEPRSTMQWQRGLHHFGRGLAQVRQPSAGGADSARVQLGRLRVVRDSVPADGQFGAHPQRGLLDIAAAILEAEIHAEGGRHAQAVRVLESVLAVEDGLDYDEPEPWPLPLRHFLGAILLEAGRPAEAEARYREDLRQHPWNGWALFGLEQALRDQGRASEAQAVQDQFRLTWTRSDVWLRGSRY